MRVVHNQYIFRAEDGRLYRRDSLTKSEVLQKDINSFSVIKLIFFVLIVCALFAFVNGSEPKSFGGFLSMLENVPTIDTQGLLSIAKFDLPDWGVFEPIAVFIESIGGIISFIIWFGAVFVNSAFVAFYFVGWLVGA